jgi:hypothetical protein
MIEPIGLDDGDEIVYSESFNIYGTELTLLPDFLGYKFKFVFEKDEPKNNQEDIVVTATGNDISVRFSRKFRASLASMTTEKISILKTADGRQILLSVFGGEIKGAGLHLTINFYLR